MGSSDRSGSGEPEAGYDNDPPYGQKEGQANTTASDWDEVGDTHNWQSQAVLADLDEIIPVIGSDIPFDDPTVSLSPRQAHRGAISQTDITVASANSSGYNFGGTEVDDMWNTLFNQGASSAAPSPTILSPDPYNLPATNIFDVSDGSPHMAYLHHYLNVVMPLQFRTAKSAAIGELVLPLAFQRSEILTSISSLAALHLAQKRTGNFTDNTATIPAGGLFPAYISSDTDAVVARSSHRDSIERLRHVTAENLTAEDVIFPSLFAVSYYLFMGGTSTQWKEVIGMCQKCLFAALAASPDLTGEFSAFS